METYPQAATLDQDSLSMEAKAHDPRGRPRPDAAIDKRAARQAFEQVLTIQPDHVYAMIRLGLMAEEEGDFERAWNLYEQVRAIVVSHLKPDVALYNEFHALIVRVGKANCRPSPRCVGCVLEACPRIEDSGRSRSPKETISWKPKTS